MTRLQRLKKRAAYAPHGQKRKRLKELQQAVHEDLRQGLKK